MSDFGEKFNTKLNTLSFTVIIFYLGGGDFSENLGFLGGTITFRYPEVLAVSVFILILFYVRVYFINIPISDLKSDLNNFFVRSLINDPIIKEYVSIDNPFVIEVIKENVNLRNKDRADLSVFIRKTGRNEIVNNGGSYQINISVSAGGSSNLATKYIYINQYLVNSRGWRVFYKEFIWDQLYYERYMPLHFSLIALTMMLTSFALYLT